MASAWIHWFEDRGCLNEFPELGDERNGVIQPGRYRVSDYFGASDFKQFSAQLEYLGLFAADPFDPPAQHCFRGCCHGSNHSPRYPLRVRPVAPLAIEHLFERASVARPLHAAGMLLRRGIGRVSVEASRAFASTDSRFIRVGELVTTREVRAEEAAFVQTALAGQANHEAIGRAGKWETSPQLGEEQARAVQTILGSRDLVTTVHGPAGAAKQH